MPFGRTPLEALALPGTILAHKYSQFRQRRRDAANKRVTERELSALHNKIEKLLCKLEETELESPSSQDDECVICINYRATMETLPCGHRVVCRRCFVKTIQSAVSQRLLPLRCVICRARINRLTSGSATWRLNSSDSSYSMGAKSWNVPSSASSYSVEAARVTQSASLYSMSSGSSCVSGISNLSSNSGTSGMSSTSSTSSSTHLGAIPRNPDAYKKGQYYNKHRGAAEQIKRLPPIIEFKSPVRRHHNSPTINPTARYNRSYTQQSANKIPDDEIELITIEKPMNKIISTKGLTSRVAPTSKSPINKTTRVSSAPATCYGGNERNDNKKNETIEKRKKEEKLKLKAEKEAKKEEKRQAKEEEKLAKSLAKEEKKRGKKDFLLNEGGSTSRK